MKYAELRLGDGKIRSIQICENLFAFFFFFFTFIGNDILTDVACVLAVR